MKNPFTIGIVHGGEGFCDRVKERADLLRYAHNGSNVVLCSPRRYGKSSLVTLVLDDLRKEGFLTAYVDLFPVSSEHDFIERFAAGVLKGIGHGVDPRSFADKVKGIFSSLRPTIEVGPDGYSISAKIDRSANLGVPLDDLMDGLLRYVKKKKVPACIVLDEFQELTELSDAKRIEGALRSHIQFHKEVSYFFVGSRRRILEDMFNNRARPFYKSAFMYAMKEIAEGDFVPFIEGRFAATGKRCSSDVAANMYRKAGGYPYYVQKLASIAWDVTSKACTQAVAEESFRALVQTEAIDFEGTWSGLAMIQKAVLKALARDPVSTPYSREYLERHQLTLGGAQKAINILLAKDLIEKSDAGQHRLTDPIMAAWLRS